MTAWTAIVVSVLIIGRCSLHMVGLEYGSELQPMSDDQFGTISTLAVVFALLVDIVNGFYATTKGQNDE